MFEFDACVGRGELPIGFGVIGISFVLPICYFVDESLFVWDAAIEALRRKDTEFGLGHIEPASVLWSIVPLCAAENYGGRSDDLTT